MTLAALHVVNTFNEIFLSYGQSDEFSFAFRRDSKLYNRRGEKILTCIKFIFNLYFKNYSYRPRFRIHLSLRLQLE
jgi:tRNA(His) guanylyltransferase